jgi:hypothetical protein
METEQHSRDGGVCRHRTKMEGENEVFWLAEAELLAKLITVTHRLRVLEQKKGRRITKSLS